MYLGEALKVHKHVRRPHWVKKYVGIRPKGEYPECSEDYLYYDSIARADGKVGVRKPWTPFHEDIIADDWIEG